VRKTPAVRSAQIAVIARRHCELVESTRSVCREYFLRH
jgi:hypothetical protein